MFRLQVGTVILLIRQFALGVFERTLEGGNQRRQWRLCRGVLKLHEIVGHKLGEGFAFLSCLCLGLLDQARFQPQGEFGLHGMLHLTCIYDFIVRLFADQQACKHNTMAYAFG